MSDLWIQPTGAALAADVHGVDLSRPGRGEVARTDRHRPITAPAGSARRA